MPAVAMSQAQVRTTICVLLLFWGARHTNNGVCRFVHTSLASLGTTPGEATDEYPVCCVSGRVFVYLALAVATTVDSLAPSISFPSWIRCPIRSCDGFSA
ncbi:hypothetical protein EI94DRAFT_1275107 [Lactarius quietus]|nr:hypothetical protein EI94DRAFT_1275107 [Lactarius quietus]